MNEDRRAMSIDLPISLREVRHLYWRAFLTSSSHMKLHVLMALLPVAYICVVRGAFGTLPNFDNGKLLICVFFVSLLASLILMPLWSLLRARSAGRSFKMDAQGISVRCADEEVTIPWHAIAAIRETNKAIDFVGNNHKKYDIPLEAFFNSAHQAEFLKYARGWHVAPK
jgi:hypothetical protein